MERLIGVLSGIVIGTSQLIYLINTIRRKIRPSVLSWAGWALLMGTTLVSQIIDNGWKWSMTTLLCSTVGCVAISIGALISRNYSFERGDWKFLALGLACIGVYLFSSNPWVTTIFAILADAALAVPTVRKAFHDPASERSPAWLLGMISSALALAICFGHELLYFLFPTYLVLLNGGITVLTWKRK